ncbi:hypothetical protein NESM_000363800 [Novymonas esmeraldas]|uniref:DUF4520 domain-containing protein n=1 Tax=Novymonas esmeraldas TaxID=1808958 RepID=A0AAW0EK71_9TRYP
MQRAPHRHRHSGTIVADSLGATAADSRVVSAPAMADTPSSSTGSAPDESAAAHPFVVAEPSTASRTYSASLAAAAHSDAPQRSSALSDERVGSAEDTLLCTSVSATTVSRAPSAAWDEARRTTSRSCSFMAADVAAAAVAAAPLSIVPVVEGEVGGLPPPSGLRDPASLLQLLPLSLLFSVPDVVDGPHTTRSAAAAGGSVTTPTTVYRQAFSQLRCAVAPESLLLTESTTAAEPLHRTATEVRGAAAPTAAASSHDDEDATSVLLIDLAAAAAAAAAAPEASGGGSNREAEADVGRDGAEARLRRAACRPPPPPVVPLVFFAALVEYAPDTPRALLASSTHVYLCDLDGHVAYCVPIHGVRQVVLCADGYTVWRLVAEAVWTRSAAPTAAGRRLAVERETISEWALRLTHVGPLPAAPASAPLLEATWCLLNILCVLRTLPSLLVSSWTSATGAAAAVRDRLDVMHVAGVRLPRVPLRLEGPAGRQTALRFIEVASAVRYDQVPPVRHHAWTGAAADEWDAAAAAAAAGGAAAAVPCAAQRPAPIPVLPVSVCVSVEDRVVETLASVASAAAAGLRSPDSGAAVDAAADPEVPPLQLRPALTAAAQQDARAALSPAAWRVLSLLTGASRPSASPDALGSTSDGGAESLPSPPAATAERARSSDTSSISSSSSGGGGGGGGVLDAPPSTVGAAAAVRDVRVGPEPHSAVSRRHETTASAATPPSRPALDVCAAVAVEAVPRCGGVGGSRDGSPPPPPPSLADAFEARVRHRPCADRLLLRERYMRQLLHTPLSTGREVGAVAVCGGTAAVMRDDAGAAAEQLAADVRRQCCVAQLLHAQQRDRELLADCPS